MRTRTIARHNWRSFFRGFSRIHTGALITMNISSPLVGAHDEVFDQPFRGISEDGNEIFIHVGDGREHPHLECRLQRVWAIQVQQTDEGADAVVDITSLDGSHASVRFRSPALPELLDPGVE